MLRVSQTDLIFVATLILFLRNLRKTPPNKSSQRIPPRPAHLSPKNAKKANTSRTSPIPNHLFRVPKPYHSWKTKHQTVPQTLPKPPNRPQTRPPTPKNQPPNTKSPPSRSAIRICCGDALEELLHPLRLPVLGSHKPGSGTATKNKAWWFWSGGMA